MSAAITTSAALSPSRFDAEAVAITRLPEESDALRQAVELIAGLLRRLGYSAGIDRLLNHGALNVPEPYLPCEACPLMEEP
jgi:hypothetical protein